jgi:hypothetical protein
MRNDDRDEFRQAQRVTLHERFVFENRGDDDGGRNP